MVICFRKFSIYKWSQFQGGSIYFDMPTDNDYAFIGVNRRSLNCTYTVNCSIAFEFGYLVRQLVPGISKKGPHISKYMDLGEMKISWKKASAVCKSHDAFLPKLFSSQMEFAFYHELHTDGVLFRCSRPCIYFIGLLKHEKVCISTCYQLFNLCILHLLYWNKGKQTWVTMIWHEIFGLDKNTYALIYIFVEELE